MHVRLLRKGAGNSATPEIFKWSVEPIEINLFGAQLASGSGIFQWLTDWECMYGFSNHIVVALVYDDCRKMKASRKYIYIYTLAPGGSAVHPFLLWCAVVFAEGMLPYVGFRGRQFHIDVAGQFNMSLYKGNIHPECTGYL